MNEENKHPPTSSYKIISPKSLSLFSGKFDLENNSNLKLMEIRVIINSNPLSNNEFLPFCLCLVKYFCNQLICHHLD